MCFSARRSRHSMAASSSAAAAASKLPTRFHLSASLLALLALVGTYSTPVAEAASSGSSGATIYNSGLLAVESSMAMYYQPGSDATSLCPPAYVGAYIAAGCESIIWCADGMLKFQTGCPEEGQRFDDSCLCCRDADEFDCRVKDIPAAAPEVEEAATPEVEGSAITTDKQKSKFADVDADAAEEEDSVVILPDGYQPDCVQCTNLPTPFMVSTNRTCAAYEKAFEKRCGTEFGWWGRDGNPEHCQYSCWANGAPYQSQQGAPCCARDDADDVSADGEISTRAEDAPTDEALVAPDAVAADCEAGFTGLSTNADCTSINVCDQGELQISMDCPVGTLFDDNTKQCFKWHRQFVCTKSQVETTTVETVEKSSDCPRGASGLSPTTDCVGYNVCFLGTKLFDTQCGTGLLFNVNTQQCERWHRGFVCGGGSTSTTTRAEAPGDDDAAAPTDDSTPTSSPTQPKVAVEIPPSAKVAPRGACPSGVTGFIPTPDCTSSNVCRNGVFKYVVDCEDGHLFDSALGRCTKWHRKFVCGGDAETATRTEDDGDLPSPTRQPTGMPTPGSGICPADFTGMVPTPSCSGSYVCRRGEFVLGPIRCPSGTFFDESTGFCGEKHAGFVCGTDEHTDDPASSPAEAGPCQPGFTGLTTTHQCKGANICRNGNYLMEMDCPAGSLFDVDVQQCVPWYRSFVCGGITPDASTEVKKGGKAKSGKKDNDDKAEPGKGGEKSEKGKKGEKDDASVKTRGEGEVSTSSLVGLVPVSPTPAPPTMAPPTPLPPTPVPPTMAPPTQVLPPRSRCPKGFSGKVPANEACSAYIFCERGQYDNEGVVPCRPNDLFVFDFLTQKCVMPFRDFECMYTILTTHEEPLAQELIAQVMAEETVSDGEESTAQEFSN